MTSSNRPSTDAHAFNSVREQDKYYLQLAFQISKQTDDPKGQADPRAAVGAIILKGKEILAISANRLPFPLQGKYLIPDANSTERYHLIEHAERSAIALAHRENKDVNGGIMYCTRFPCSDCARAIANAGLTQLIVPTGFSGETRWVDSQRAALKLLRMSGVKIRYQQP